VLVASCLFLVAVAAAGLAAPDSGIATKPVQVEFDAPAGCSGAEAFFDSLRSRTDRVRQAEASEPHITLQVRLSRARGRVLGELRVVDDRGGADTRKVQGASCDDVVQALSLTAALAVDPSALLTAPATAPEPSATAMPSAPPPAPIVLAPKPPSESPESSVAQIEASTHARTSRFELGAGAATAALLTSNASPGVALAAWWTLAGKGFTRTTLGLAATYLRNDVLQSPSDVQVSLAGFGAAACPIRLGISILTLQPCAQVLAGWFVATGRQVAHTYSVSHLWLSTGGILRTTAYLGHGLSLDLEGGISAPLFKRRFFATTSDNVVGETPSISPVAALGLTYGF
jgi:hypothetical protein